MNLDLTRLRTDLLDFYDRRKRDLPWRRDTDPYRILVSEIMLQQTRVDTVISYYEGWLRRFPDIEALATAEEGKVLKAWEGLGYYRRARNLHAAAQAVRERWEGEVPSTEAGLRELPGVGEYTAGAVASIAFGHAVPAVDGNVRRVLARLCDVANPAGRWLRETATVLVDRDRPGDWNQALMELGATVCTPRSPHCESCPVAWACAAKRAGTVGERPAPKVRRAPRKAVIALAVLRTPEGQILLQRRGADRLLGGMWGLPECEVDRPEDAGESVRVMARELLAMLSGGLPPGAHGPGPGEPEPLRHVRHRFTHIDATYVPWIVPVARAVAPMPPGEPANGAESAPEVRWTSRTQQAALPVSVAQRAVLAQL